jgi:hypothetical protein
MRLSINDIHKVFCGPGIVEFCKSHHLDLRSIMRNGIEENELRAKGVDAEVDMILAAKNGVQQ